MKNMPKEIGCKTGLNKNIIKKVVFDRELKLCRELNKKSEGKGCRWGKCKNCGVIPLLYKLHKGILIEDKKELRDVRKNIFVL